MWLLSRGRVKRGRLLEPPRVLPVGLDLAPVFPGVLEAEHEPLGDPRPQELTAESLGPARVTLAHRHDQQAEAITDALLPSVEGVSADRREGGHAQCS